MDDQIKHWLSLNDKEISSLQLYVFDYIETNNSKIDKRMCCYLGAIATDFQYNMRCVKELLVTSESLKMASIINFIEAINHFEGLALFLKQRLIEDFNKKDIVYKWHYLDNDKRKHDGIVTSHFNRTVEENLEIEEEGWSVISKKITKYQKRLKNIKENNNNIIT